MSGPPIDTTPSYALPRDGSDTSRNLKIALGAVIALALIGPLLVFLLVRGSDDSTTTETVVGADTDATTTPDPNSDTSTAPAPGAPVAAAPTAVPQGSAPVASAPVVAALPGDAPAVYKVTGITAGSALNVRQSAGTTNALIGTLASDATGIAGTGRRVTVDGSEWREIKVNNGTGWVFAGYLALAPAPAAAATPAPTATPAAVTMLEASAPAIYNVTGLNPGTSLNVRAEPGRTQRLLGTIPGNTAAVPGTGRRAMVGDVEWREVGFRTGFGWVTAANLTVVPEAPKTVLLPSVPTGSVAIVALTSPTERLALRADPGYTTTIVGTVGASSVNVATTGRLAQIDTEVWQEITVSGVTGWVPLQLTNPNPRSATDVISTSGVAAVTIDKVTVADDGTVTLQIGSQEVKVAPSTTIVTAAGSAFSVADWSATAKTATNAIIGEITVVGNQVTRIWLTS